MSEKSGEYKKPLPEITTESRPFWEGTTRHELLLQRCRRCGTLQHYPRGICASCWAAELEWVKSSGRGRVYTYTATHRSQARGFKDELPYVLAYIELDEGVQMLANIVQCDPARVAIGMAVRVVFEDVTPEISLPKFAPAA